jgi:hypothetical protein
MSELKDNHTVTVNNLEEANAQLRQLLKKVEDDFQAEREKLRNIRMIVGLAQGH